jgi:hypothetical protein
MDSEVEEDATASVPGEIKKARAQPKDGLGKEPRGTSSSFFLLTCSTLIAIFKKLVKAEINTK